MALYVAVLCTCACKIWKDFAAVFTATLCCVLCFAMPVAAGKTIRVGFVSYPAFFEFDSAWNPSGYASEYLRAVAEYTGWTYDTVKLDNIDEAVQKMQSNEIDLFVPCVMTPARQFAWDYSTYAIGATYGALLIAANRTDIQYDDFAAIAKLRVGCLKLSPFRAPFFQMLLTRHAPRPKMHYFETREEMYNAMNIGAIDAVVDVLLAKDNDMTVVGRFAPSLLYIAVNKEQRDVFEELNSALHEIKTSYPDFESELERKYLHAQRLTPMTRDELHFVRQMSPLRVALSTDRDPLSFYDPDEQATKGITQSLLDRISQTAGLQFEYVSLPQKELRRQKLKQHDVHIVANVARTSHPGIQDNILTRPYLITQRVFVGRAGEKFSPLYRLKVALSPDQYDTVRLLAEKYPHFGVLQLDSVDECFEAVRTQRADLLVQNRYVVERQLTQVLNQRLAIIPQETLPEHLCLELLPATPGSPLYSQNELRLLMSVLNKSIAYLSNEDISREVLANTINRQNRFSLYAFLYTYRHLVAGILLTLIAVVLALGYTAHLRRRHAKLARTNEQRLSNIANTISGGVVVARPDEEYRLVYANDGFLELAGFPPGASLQADVCNSQTIAVFVASLRLGVAFIEESSQTMIRNMRIFRPDGHEVPVLLRGKIGVNEHGQRELYCTLMDISEHIRTAERLKMEQERYKLLVEKSGNLIFDFDIRTGQLTTSTQFETFLGWKIPHRCRWTDAIHLLRVHEEDNARLQTTLSILTAQGDAQCIVRLLPKNREPLWCHISMHLLKKNDLPQRVIGTVADVNSDVLEREVLLQRSRCDALTGLHNKKSFIDEARNILQTSPEEPHALVFIDLDNFKQLNDTLGHLVGDEALCDVTASIQAVFDTRAMYARFGGDEFCLLTHDISVEELEPMLVQLNKRLCRRYGDIAQQDVTVSGSIGVAWFSRHASTLHKLMACADSALYAAKRQGKNQFAVFDSTMTQSHRLYETRRFEH